MEPYTIGIRPIGAAHSVRVGSVTFSLSIWLVSEYSNSRAFGPARYGNRAGILGALLKSNVWPTYLSQVAVPHCFELFNHFQKFIAICVEYILNKNFLLPIVRLPLFALHVQ